MHAHYNSDYEPDYDGAWAVGLSNVDTDFVLFDA